MRTAIFYFSGTGNTERVVKTWLSALQDEQIEAESFRIESCADVNFESYDKIGIAYPIHAFNAPKVVLNFAKKIPRFSSPKPVYLIMVSGEPLRLNDSSDQKLKKILKRKNADVESRWHYIMPYNMIFRHTEEQAWKMNETMKRVVPLDVHQYFIKGKTNQLRPIPATAPLTAAFRIEQWFSGINGKYFRITENCTKCMKCAENCPVGNIEYRDGNFVFLNKCTLCMRCSFSCPKDAIRIGLLNGWRVNGVYRFQKPKTKEIQTHENYCRKSYERYFREAEKRVHADKNAQ